MKDHKNIESLFSVYLEQQHSREDAAFFLHIFCLDDNEAVIKRLIENELNDAQDENLQTEAATTATLEALFNSITDVM